MRTIGAHFDIYGSSQIKRRHPLLRSVRRCSFWEMRGRFDAKDGIGSAGWWRAWRL
jgi:hypothetical protein